MPKTKADIRVRTLNALVRHPMLSYRAIQTGKDSFEVGQFYGEKQVAII